MDIKRETHYIRTWQKHLFLDVSSTIPHCFRIFWNTDVIATQPLPSHSRCLQNHYIAKAVILLLILKSLPSNGFTYHIIHSPSSISMYALTHTSMC
jgi:hypothetical protein